MLLSSHAARTTILRTTRRPMREPHESSSGHVDQVRVPILSPSSHGYRDSRSSKSAAHLCPSLVSSLRGLKLLRSESISEYWTSVAVLHCPEMKRAALLVRNPRRTLRESLSIHRGCCVGVILRVRCLRNTVGEVLFELLPVTGELRWRLVAAATHAVLVCVVTSVFGCIEATRGDVADGGNAAMRPVFGDVVHENRCNRILTRLRRTARLTEYVT